MVGEIFFLGWYGNATAAEGWKAVFFLLLNFFFMIILNKKLLYVRLYTRKYSNMADGKFIDCLLFVVYFLWDPWDLPSTTTTSISKQASANEIQFNYSKQILI